MPARGIDADVGNGAGPLLLWFSMICRRGASQLPRIDGVRIIGRPTIDEDILDQVLVII
jgi:hypothetical protein